MKKFRWISTLLIFVVLNFAFISCRKADDTNNQKNQTVNVNIEILQPSKLIDAVQTSGVVKAFEDANISPEEGGVVKAWVAQKGQSVKKGDVLILLKDEVMKASFEGADAQFKIADLNAEKQKKVFDEQGISELQYKTMVYSRDAAKANADLMKARYDRTQIKSPIDGIVDNIIPNVGEYAPPGMPIARVVNNTMVKIQAEVPELYSGTLSVGTSAIITFDALPGDTLRGRVTFVGSTVSAANRTLQVEIILSNPFHKLKPEMVAKVKLIREIKNNALVVSENIIQLVDRDRYVVYVENNGKAEERHLQLGGRQGFMIEVLEGLNFGDHLIVNGYQKLVNGTPVAVVQ